MAYSDFLDKELIQFSRYDNTRSIPCMADGFKPSQRKVLFGAFKRRLTNEIKVVQFSGYISELRIIMENSRLMILLLVWHKIL